MPWILSEIVAVYAFPRQRHRMDRRGVGVQVSAAGPWWFARILYLMIDELDNHGRDDIGFNVLHILHIGMSGMLSNLFGIPICPLIVRSSTSCFDLVKNMEQDQTGGVVSVGVV